MDDFLRQKLDNIKKIISKNWDCVFIIDGLERSGKSTLGLTCAYYLMDGDITTENICSGTKDAVYKLEKLPDKSLLLIDEGSLLFSSKDTMKQEQRRLLKILNVIGQKNMILIVVLPCFFEVNRYIATQRSRFLLHCYTDETLTRGRFSYFGRKKLGRLYINGKKNFNSYAKPQSDFIGRYTDFNPLGEEYLKAKKEALFSALHEDEKPDKTKEIRYNIFKNLKNEFPKISVKKIAELMNLEYHSISRYNKEYLLEKGELVEE